MKKDKGSIAIFVLVALLFMSAFLIISFASNVNKSKIVREQFNIISGIYAYANGEEGAYDKAYSDLRNKNKQTMTASSENSSTLELTKTFDENMSNYRIYGNSVQDTTNGAPSPTNPVEIKSLGDKTNNLFDINQINSSSVEIVNDTLKLKTYAISTGITPSEFLEMTGLKIGDTITITRTCEVVKGKAAMTGWVCFLSKVSDVSTITLVTYDKNIGTVTIPENFLDENFYGLYIYGANADDNGESLTIYRDFKIIKGSYTKETIPEYEPYGKYKISIKLTDENEKSETKNIYLDEPLRKVGDVADYIDFKNGKVVRNVGKIDSYNGETITTSWISSTGELSTGATVYYVLNTPIEETVILPQLKSFEDCTKIEVLTSVAPSKIEVEYMGYTLE